MRQKNEPIEFQSDFEKDLFDRIIRKQIEPEEINHVLADAWSGVHYNESSLYNPLDKMPSDTSEFFPQYLTWLMSQPDYFYFLIRSLFQMKSFPFQCMALRELYNHRFPMFIAARGASKSSTLGMYALITMITRPGIKIVITGAGFRQAKVVFQYMEDVWKKSKMLQSCYPGRNQGPTHGTDAWVFRIGHSVAFALPIGHDGSKIRGYRANVLMADEFASVQRQIFEEVLGPFLSVVPDPIAQIDHSATLKGMDAFGKINAGTDLVLPEVEDPGILQNQLILSGTAYYKHNHFYQYFNKWRAIIQSGGDPAAIMDYVSEDEELESINWKDYSIIRMPIELITTGFMDKAQIDRIKASTSRDVYTREFSAVFSDDSDGFYKMSLIKSCTISEDNKITKVNPANNQVEEVKCTPKLYGELDKKYVFGIDPAYEGDNFAIVVLECEPTYRKIVHVWTTQSSDHKQLLSEGIIDENNYYQYCARKIRNLMKRFPCAYIGIDSQGGGKAIIEALRDESKLEPGERLILPVPDPTKKPEDTDHLDGDKILYIVNFTNEWISDANHLLKKDMELRDIIFPYHDTLNFAMAEFYDTTMGAHNTLYDTMEDCLYEIQELKNELTIIQITETPTGKQKFDTPEVKLGIQKKGRLRKDRYSALLISNFVARSAEILLTRAVSINQISFGGFHARETPKHPGRLFNGNSAIAAQLSELYK